MELNQEEEETLKKQGLKEDIRNQLVTAKNIAPLFKKWKNEKNPTQKEKIFKLLETQIEQLPGNVDHICESLEFFECKLKTDT
jgi:hypothetical protein